VTIHEASGRTVAVLHEGRLSAGEHAFAWSGTDTNGRRVPSGAYFVRVRTSAGARLERVVLIR